LVGWFPNLTRAYDNNGRCPRQKFVFGILQLLLLTVYITYKRFTLLQMVHVRSSSQEHNFHFPSFLYGLAWWCLSSLLSVYMYLLTSWQLYQASASSLSVRHSSRMMEWLSDQLLMHKRHSQHLQEYAPALNYFLLREKMYPSLSAVLLQPHQQCHQLDRGHDCFWLIINVI